MAREVLSGCAVRAAIQNERAAPSIDMHYLSAIKLRLKALYELTPEPNIKEQISDEVDWIESQSGNVLLNASAPDLLALLKDLYAHGYTTSGDHDRVREAITKATGKEPV